MSASLTKPGNGIHNTACHQNFGAVFKDNFGDVTTTLRREQPPVIAVHLEGPSLANSVDYQQITALALQLGAGVKEHIAVCVARFRGKPDDCPHLGQLPVCTRTNHTGQHIGVAQQLNGRVILTGGPVALFDLAGRNVGRPEICHRCRHDQRFGRRSVFGDSVLQLRGGADMHHLDASGIR